MLNHPTLGYLEVIASRTYGGAIEATAMLNGECIETIVLTQAELENLKHQMPVMHHAIKNALAMAEAI